MKDLIETVIKKVDKLDNRLDSVDKTLIKQEENLKEHMRRTEILESQHSEMREEVHIELEPIKSHVNQVKGIAKFLSIAIPITVAIIGVVYKFIK